MRLTKEQEAFLFEVFKDGYREGSKMRWPEMVFWMALIVWLFNLAMGGA